jgi:hypothetical protein
MGLEESKTTQIVRPDLSSPRCPGAREGQGGGLQVSIRFTQISITKLRWPTTFPASSPGGTDFTGQANGNRCKAGQKPRGQAEIEGKAVGPGGRPFPGRSGGGPRKRLTIGAAVIIFLDTYIKIRAGSSVGRPGRNAGRGTAISPLGTPHSSEFQKERREIATPRFRAAGRQFLLGR